MRPAFAHTPAETASTPVVDNVRVAEAQTSPAVSVLLPVPRLETCASKLSTISLPTLPDVESADVALSQIALTEPASIVVVPEFIDRVPYAHTSAAVILLSAETNVPTACTSVITVDSDASI